MSMTSYGADPLFAARSTAARLASGPTRLSQKLATILSCTMRFACRKDRFPPCCDVRSTNGDEEAGRDICSRRLGVGRRLKESLVLLGRRAAKKLTFGQRNYAKRIPKASAFIAEIEMIRYRGSLFDRRQRTLSFTSSTLAAPMVRRVLELARAA